MKHKKAIWIIGGLLLTIVVCGLLAHLGSGMLGMVRAHLGM